MQYRTVGIILVVIMSLVMSATCDMSATYDECFHDNHKFLMHQVATTLLVPVVQLVVFTFGPKVPKA